MKSFVITGPEELFRFLSWSNDFRNGIYQDDVRVGTWLTKESAIFMILCQLKKGSSVDLKIEFRSYTADGFDQYLLVYAPEEALAPYMEVNGREVADLSFLEVYAKVKMH